MASRVTLCCVLLAAACARTTLQSSVADKYGGAKPNEEMDFWDGLAVQPAVSNRDAIHALCLSFGGAPGAYAEELKVAKERGWVADDADLAANETARVGMVARAVCLQADIKGGATMRVFGPVERYAVKELNYMQWLPDMTPSHTISGGQLIAVLSKAEDRIRGRKDEGPKEDM
jgi:hypothetical protein